MLPKLEIKMAQNTQARIIRRGSENKAYKIYPSTDQDYQFIREIEFSRLLPRVFPYQLGTFYSSKEETLKARAQDANLRGDIYMIEMELASKDLEQLVTTVWRNQIDINLRERLNQVVQVAEQIGESLFILHSLDLVHLDVKPRNILVFNQDTEFRLADFDSVTNVFPHAHSNGKDYGTVNYQHPSLKILNEGDTFSPMLDYYALGMTVARIFLLALNPMLEPFSSSKRNSKTSNILSNILNQPYWLKSFNIKPDQAQSYIELLQNIPPIRMEILVSLSKWIDKCITYKNGPLIRPFNDFFRPNALTLLEQQPVCKMFRNLSPHCIDRKLDSLALVISSLAPEFKDKSLLQATSYLAQHEKLSKETLTEKNTQELLHRVRLWVNYRADNISTIQQSLAKNSMFLKQDAKPAMSLFSN